MAFDKAKYDKEYNRAHVVRKFVPFNDTKPEDVELLKWLACKHNVTQYVKALIRDDMERQRKRIREQMVNEIRNPETLSGLPDLLY